MHRTAFAVGLSLVLAACASYGRAAPPEPFRVPVRQEVTGPIWLAPHDFAVAAAAYSPDGRTLATGCQHGYVRVWNARTGALQSIFGDEASRGISGLAYSPDGTRIATVGVFLDHEVKLWDAATGKLVDGFAGKDRELNVFDAVAFSPDGQTLAWAGPRIELRNLRTGETIATPKHPGRASAIAFAPDGKHFASGGEDRRVRIWNAQDGRLERTLTGPKMRINTIAFAPDGDHVLAGASGAQRAEKIADFTAPGEVWSWNQDSNEGTRVAAVSGRVRAIAFQGANQLVVSAGRNLLLAKVAADRRALGNEPRALHNHSEEILCVAVSPDGRQVVSGSYDRTADVVDAATGKLIHRLPGVTEFYNSVATSPDGRTFATATADVRFSHRFQAEDESFAARYRLLFQGENAARVRSSQLTLWSASDGQQLAARVEVDRQVTALAYRPRTDELAVAGWSHDGQGFAELRNAKTLELVRSFAAHPSEVLSLAFSPDGQTLATGGADGNVRLWDAASGKLRANLAAKSRVDAVAFSPDGKLIATAAGDHKLRLWDAKTNEELHASQRYKYIESLAFSPDGKLLALGMREPVVVLWSVAERNIHRLLGGPGDYVANMPGFVAFSPNGQYVAAGGSGKAVAIWDVAQSQLRSEMLGHFHVATAAAFLPDGRLVTGGEDRAVRMWDPRSGKLLATWFTAVPDEGQHWQAEWVGFTPEGEYVASQRHDRVVGWLSGAKFVEQSAAEKEFRRATLPLGD